MAKKVFVADWDGTFTLVDKEVELFRAGMMEDLAGITGEELRSIQELCLEMEQEILQNPGDFAVMNNGKPSCRATDPYCIWDPIIRRVLNMFEVFEKNEETKNRFIDSFLFKYNARKAITVFNPQAKTVLKNLMTKNNEVEAFIVSASHTESLKRKINFLRGAGKSWQDWWVEKLAGRAYGSAKKFELDDDFDLIPESINIPNLNRPIYLRRRRYYDILLSILKTTKSDWKDLVVVGDHLEIDLILPHVLGAKIGLVVNDFTPKYEIDFVQNSPNSRIITDLKEVFDLLR